jgi:hypothetical protein
LNEELSGLFADANMASNRDGGGKRKRVSNYMTPVSSYALLHPLCGVDDTLGTLLDSAVAFRSSDKFNNSAHVKLPSIQELPEESIVMIASYLPPSQVRNMSLINHHFRQLLLRSQGAKEGLWMQLLRDRFPQVFTADVYSNEAAMNTSERKMLTYSEVTFVDCLPNSSTRFTSKMNSRSTDSSALKEANLALLTALIPTRYPRQIDESTLKMDERRHPFRMFSLPVGGKLHCNNDVDQNASDALAPVVQFMGRVGTGDRCIRSDQAFPSIKKITDQNTGAGNSRLPWQKSKNGKSPTGSNTMDTAGSSLSSVTLTPNSPMAVALSPPRPSIVQSPPHSPLLRFLSSLSHHSDSTMHGSLSSDSMQFDRQDSEEDIGTNNYGVFNFGKCKERLGKIARGCKSKQVETTKPFVVPTFLSRQQYQDACNSSVSQCQIGPDKKLVVDLTPRLCAYFEVTILKHSDKSKQMDMDGEVTSNHQRDDMEISTHNPRRLAPRPANSHALPRRHGWRNPHGMLPMHPLVGVGMAIQDDIWFPPLPMPRELDHDGGVRHDCVAIGLSTMMFNPRGKMPGWDSNSFGYHGDDGGIFHGHGDMIRQYGPSFGPGDSVGCGIEYTSKRIFFVKNGQFLGFAFDTLSDDVIERGLYPTIGVDTECPLFVNFGARAFCFDLGKFVRRECHDVEG